MLGEKRQVIMLVDDNQANLNMGKNMLKDFYEVYALPSAERLFAFLETATPDLILLDVAMPHMNGFDVIRILKADAKYADIHLWQLGYQDDSSLLCAIPSVFREHIGGRTKKPSSRRCVRF